MVSCSLLSARGFSFPLDFSKDLECTCKSLLWKPSRFCLSKIIDASLRLGEKSLRKPQFGPPFSLSIADFLSDTFSELRLSL